MVGANKPWAITFPSRGATGSARGRSHDGQAFPNSLRAFPIWEQRPGSLRALVCPHFPSSHLLDCWFGLSIEHVYHLIILFPASSMYQNPGHKYRDMSIPAISLVLG